MAISHASIASGEASAITRLQGDAWEWWNASYHTPLRDIYRNVSVGLYQEDMSRRILALFARSDAQNLHLDAVLSRQSRAKASRS